MNFYEHHIGDFAEATAHLSFVEDAAYSRLIRKYYSTEKPLPTEPRAVERLIGARTKEEREAVKVVLEEFFRLDADGWHNKRCDEELDRYHEKQRKARQSAESRWNKESGRTANGMRTHKERNANASETHDGRNALQSPVPSPQSPDSNPQSEIPERAREGGAGPETGGDPAADPYELRCRIEAIYPPGTYRASNWILAERAISKLLGDGAMPDDLLALTRAFRAQQDAKGSTGTQFVLSPEKFFGPDGHWRGPFPLPAAKQPAPLKRMKTAHELAEELDPNNTALGAA